LCIILSCIRIYKTLYFVTIKIFFLSSFISSYQAINYSIIQYVIYLHIRVFILIASS
jgi:hypothetical protein